MERVIIDTDIGFYYDDAFAVLFAAQSPELKVEAVTTVYGDVDLRARITCKLLEIAGRDEIPVAAGIGKPMKGDVLMFGIEGTNIIDDGEAKKKPENIHAVDLIIEKIMNSPGKITLITIGPVTNVAAALIKEPAIARAAKRLIMMGGVIVPFVDENGVPRSPIEENNFNSDQIASEIVFNSEMKKLMVPIDVTFQVPLTDSHLQKIRDTDTPVARQVAKILEVWPEQVRLIHMSMGIPVEFSRYYLHDPLTVAVAFYMSLVTIVNLHIELEYPPTIIPRDMLIRYDILRTIPKKRPPNMEVAVEVDADRFTDLFVERITK